MRHSYEFIGRRLASRSAVDEASPVVNGCRCRVWTGKSLRGGYCRLWDGDRLVDGHRLALELKLGRPIGLGLDALHACDRNACIEPEHLREGTAKENTAEMIAKGRHLVGRIVASEKLQGRLGQRGEKHPKAKLTRYQAREIKMRLRRARYRTDEAASLARRFKVSDSLVRGIGAGRNWGWL